MRIRFKVGIDSCIRNDKANEVSSAWRRVCSCVCVCLWGGGGVLTVFYKISNKRGWWMHRDKLSGAASKTVPSANRLQVQSKLQEVHFPITLLKLWYSLPLILWTLKFYKNAREALTSLWMVN